MPVDIAWEPRCVLATFHGDLNADTIFDACRRIEGDHRFDDLRFSIIDLSRLDVSLAGEELLQEIAAENWAASASNGRLSTVVVARHPDVVDAVRRYQAAMPVPRHIPDVRICGSLEEAKQSLGLAP